MRNSILLVLVLGVLVLSISFISRSSFVFGQEPVEALLHISNNSEKEQLNIVGSTNRVFTTWTTSNDDPGKICTTIDFEGIGDLSPVPEFDGITSPGWLGIIDEDAGGTGNFAFEPSPSTIAFWLGGDPNSRYINFVDPVSEVSFFYASAVDIQLEAFDANGNSVSSTSGAANWDQGPGGDPNGTYNKWDPLSLEAENNIIVSVAVLGNANQTGIDDLKICRTIGIDSVEFTQAIQEWQTLDQLKADIANDKQPPVPIIAGKPLALRVYMKEVNTTAGIRIEMSGVATAEQSIQLQPNCSPEQSRLQSNGCQSIDFYFTPPSGDWTATIKVFDQDDNEVESHDFTIRSVDAEPITFGAVQVCDSVDSSGNWQCETNYHTRLAELVSLARKIAPTHEVSVFDTGEVIRRDINTYDTNNDGTIDGNEATNWWVDTADDIGDLYTIFDWLRDFFGWEDRIYYGMVRPVIPGGILGIANGIPSQGALSITTATDLGQDVSQDTVAHEAFHTLGRRHTNTNLPIGGAPNTAPGCGFARDPGTDWPFANNRIQSVNRLEVGFDVATKQALDPQNTFDIMSYCVPVWISPHTYERLLDDALFYVSQNREQALIESGDFWLVSGSIEGANIALDPLMILNTVGSIDVGNGNYLIQVLDADSNVLFTRFFTPFEAHTRVASGYEDVEGNPTFSELIPFQSVASQIVVFDSSLIEIGSIDLAGDSPIVTITFPAGGETLHGNQTLTWDVIDADSVEHTFWVQYSAENGSEGTWRNLAINLTEPNLTVNFDQLPGSNGDARIRVIASDSINSGTNLSPQFSVTKKSPLPVIIFPQTGTAFQENQLVWLQGEAHDTDEGFLRDTALSWSSNIDGILGTGNSLPITNLSEGQHTISLTATDDDGNVVSTTIAVFVDGMAPALSLNIIPDGTPASCVVVSIGASEELGGSGLNTIEYSLDGGSSWDNYSRLFFVPGTGFFHLIARATDNAGNRSIADQRFFIDNQCSREITSVHLPVIIKTP